MRLHIARLLALLTVIVTGTALAMPPHPDLVQRIRNGEQPEPYALQHRSELLAEGVDNSPHTRTIHQLMRRALDENLNILAIFVDFSDHPAATPTVTFNRLFFGDQVGSLKNYYNQISYGSLTLVTVNLPGDLGWERAPQTYSYYVAGQNGFGSYPRNAQRLAEDAVQLVDDVVDFSQYDNDGDGHVDALFIVHTGAGAERSGNNNDIWSHKWQMHTPQNVDGVIADVYSMEPEYWDTPGDMTCGVYAHEMGHSVFGLPDLYDTDYTSEGLGRWTLMAGGSWNGPNGGLPANPDAWCRVQMGFATPTIITGNQTNVPVPCIENTPSVFRLWTDGQAGSEYFLVENRQRTGYDAALPGDGLMIYHVDESQWGNTNEWYPEHTQNGHYRVALEQADGQWHLEHNQNQGDLGDPFPGTGDHHSFTGHSIPDSRDYSGTDRHVSVRHIGESASTMLASFMVSSTINQAFVFLPETTVVAGTELSIPLRVEDNVTSQNIRSLQFTLRFDSTLVHAEAPFYDLAATVIPNSWSVNVSNPTSGTLNVTASGTTSLTGQGSLLDLRFHVPESVPDSSLATLLFTSFTFNQGTPVADTTSGRLFIIAPIIAIQPPVLNAGYARVGQPTTRAFLIRNAGGAPLTVTSVTNSPFLTSNFTTQRTVDPQSWTAVRLYFTPAATQLYTDTLVVRNLSADSVVRVPFSVQGAEPAIALSAFSLDFDSATIGGRGEQTLTVSDTGFWDLTVSSMQFATGTAFQIATAPSWPDLVPAQESHHYVIRFLPTSPTTYEDTLIIAHDAGTPVRVPVRGRGVFTGVSSDPSSALPSAYYLSQNYPNPFNPSTTFEFGVPSTSHVSIRVYDLLGREVSELADATFSAGRYRVQWDSQGAAAGVYLVTMSGDNLRIVRKATVLK